jgi:hypothetical protein
MAVDQQGNVYLTGWTASTNFPIVGTSISPTPNGDANAFVSKLNASGTALVYSTYLGGTYDEYGSALALDSNGYAYVTGITFSTDFPVTANAYQSNMGNASGTGNPYAGNAYLSKLSADGQSLLYSTYLGGDDFDWPQGVAVDGSQNAYLTGYTTAASFPTTSNAYQGALNSIQNAFVSRIDTTQSGASSLIYSSFLGGSGGDSGIGIAVDSNHRAYITGKTCSSDFPITQTAYQSTVGPNCSAFLSQLDTSATSNQGLIYSTFLGGTTSSSSNPNGDGGTAIALGSNQHAYIAGYATSPNFPVTTSGSNSTNGKDFVAEFDTTKSQSASLIHSTLVGGSGGESMVNQSLGLAIDGIGNAYIGGNTQSTDFPVTSNAIQSSPGANGQNEYLAVLSPDASTIIYGTYLGGAGGLSGSYYELVSGLALDQSNNIYVSGTTTSSNFQTTTGALQTSLAGGYDGFVMKLTALPVPMISSLSSLYGPGGAQITISGSNFGSPQGSSTVTFGSTIATINTWSSTSIVAIVPGGITPGMLQVTVNTALEPSNPEPFLVTSTPTIASLSSAAGAVGLHVTINGSGFGAGPGASVTFNGTTATPVSWNSGQIVVPVPSLATTGNIVVHVVGVDSNGASFAVVAPPTISASATPAANAAGWTNLNATVTFTCTPGDLAIASCSSPQTVSTEGTGQVVSGTVTDTAGDTATASVTINLDKTIPALSVTSPADGTSFSTSSVTVTSTLTDALSGVSGVTCNGVTATLSGGVYSCNISLTVGVNLVVVRGTDIAGNVAGSNFHVSLSGSLSAATSLQVTPTGVNMVVGNSQQFTVVDQLGRPRTDATWTVDNTSTATIDTNSSPTLTAVAVGQATLTANVGGVTAQTQVNILTGASLSDGTVRWSAPAQPGFTTTQVLKAVPSENGPDIYVTQIGPSNQAMIEAFTVDGRLMWKNSVNGNTGGYLGLTPAPDGGVIAQGQIPYHNYMAKIDGVTGSEVWRYILDVNPLDGQAIHPDGTIYFIEPYYDRATGNSGTQGFLALDGNTGTPRFRLAVPNSRYRFVHQNGCSDNANPEYDSSGQTVTYGPPAIMEDGTTQIEFLTADSITTELFAQNCRFYAGRTLQYSYQLLVWDVSRSGQVTSTVLKQISGADNCIHGGFDVCAFDEPIPQEVIPDGQGGSLAAWKYQHNAYSGLPEEAHVEHVSSAGMNDFTLAFHPSSTPWFGFHTILGENNVLFASDSSHLEAADFVAGQTLWGYQPPSGKSIGLLQSAADGRSVATLVGSGNSSTLVRIDSSGAAATDSWSAANLQYYYGDQFLAFSSASSTTFDALSAVPILSGSSEWASFGNDGDRAAGADCACDFESTDPSVPPPPPQVCPICALPAPTGTQATCTSISGNQSTYLLLVGDPGLPGHDVYNAFNLAAQTEMNALQAQGHLVIACRVSTVDYVVNALTTHGVIDGGVIYFGHSGLFGYEDASGHVVAYSTNVFVGQSPAASGYRPNINTTNVNSLAAVQTGNAGSNSLGGNAVFTINGCEAGLTIDDYLSQTRTAIAQPIANNLKRGVYAYDVGMYFGPNDIQDDRYRTGVGRIAPAVLPVYMVPDGAPGHKPGPIPFTAR